MKKILISTACLCLGIVCLAQNRSSTPRVQSTKSQQVSQENAQASPLPFTKISLPYAGYGEVTLLDEGTIILRVGVDGEFKPTSDSGASPTPLEVVAGTLETTGLALAEHNGEFFLDRDNQQVAERELSEGSFNRMPIAPAHRLTGTPQAVAQFAGALYLSTSSNRSSLDVGIRDLANDLRTFHTKLLMASSVNTKPIPDAFPLIAVEGQVAASACSASCTEGSCSIDCPAKCEAYCEHSGRIPHCECVGGLM